VDVLELRDVNVFDDGISSQPLSLRPPHPFKFNDERERERG
jgi:hypothetical protein